MTNLTFQKFILDFRNGDLEAALSEHLETIGGAMRDFDGKASLSLKLEFKRTKSGQIEVDAKVAVKVPEKGVRPSMFFITPDGAFTRKDPAQYDLEDLPGARRGISLINNPAAE